MRLDKRWNLFKCQRCGKCCIEIGLPYDPERVFEIAKFLNLSVEEVIKIGDDLVQELPESTSAMTQGEYIKGIGMLDKRMIIMLNVEKVLEKIEAIEPEALKQVIDEVKKIEPTKE